MTTRLYLLHLNPEARGLADRYSVMRLTDAGFLSPLWGEIEGDAKPADNPTKAAKAWPYMVYYRRPSAGPDRYPAFHFKLGGYGYSKVQELAEALAERLGDDIELFPVTGWNSSPVKATPRTAR